MNNSRHLQGLEREIKALKSRISVARDKKDFELVSQLERKLIEAKDRYKFWLRWGFEY